MLSKIHLGTLPGCGAIRIFGNIVLGTKSSGRFPLLWGILQKAATEWEEICHNSTNLKYRSDYRV